MKTKLLPLSSFLGAFALLASPPLTGTLRAQSDYDPPALYEIDEHTKVDFQTPTFTFNGTRGLSQTASAQALGEGRFTVGVSGMWYQQQENSPGLPNKGANIFTEVTAISLGLNRYFDLFGTLSSFGSNNYDNKMASGLGATSGGLQASLPFPSWSPIRIAAQGTIAQGLSENVINDHFADGFQHFEVQKHLLFTTKLLETLIFGEEETAVKLHFNQGVTTSSHPGQGPLLILAMAAQFNWGQTAFGLQVNSRTSLRNVSILNDPFWFTPGLHHRVNRSFSMGGGVDVRLSQERSNSDPRALSPFRPYARLIYSFDTYAPFRREVKEKAVKIAAFEDSPIFSLVPRRIEEESWVVDLRECARRDSLLLFETRKKLFDERDRRLKSEKQLLSTGMVLAVYFETGRRTIPLASKPYLDLIARMLTNYPKFEFEVSGHTDNVGSPAYNKKLSLDRAEAVKNYLIAQAPDLNGRLKAKGYGQKNPKYVNTAPEARKFNRRTELLVLNQEALVEFNL